jgi:DNA modification methylase
VSESFLNGKVTLHRGDCLEVLPLLEANSIDSCVTDPPYHLTSIVKRFGSTNAAPAQHGTDGAYARASKGFMGKQWDGGDIAFRPELWAEVLRVLKPGAHLLAFSGTRTYHRMACAIEDAGFEIRDQIGWCYGSGFPKSHDVSKGIDRAAGAEREVVGTRDTYTGKDKNWCVASPRLMNVTAPATAAAIQWQGWGTALKPAWEPIVLARKPLSESSIAANVLKHSVGGLNIDACRVETTAQRPYIVQSWEQEQHLCASCAAPAASKPKHTAPATKASIATKPAAQTLSEKELSSQPAINSEDIGCLDGTRAGNTNTNSSIAESGKPQTDQSQADTKSTILTETRATTDSKTCSSCGAEITEAFTNGSTPQKKNGSLLDGKQPAAIGARWPANLIHDGSEEVLAGFPETQSGLYKAGSTPKGLRQVYGQDARGGYQTEQDTYGDSGSAARFFYTAKADADDRLGSKHPTVKPLDLMGYLVRLVTPKGGVVLDPFAGTGTTGEAAYREGVSAVLIEREEEYQADIVKRMGLCLSGPDTRKAASTKQLPPDDLPMFGGGV